DHRHPVAADAAHVLFIERQQVGAFEIHRAANDFARRIRHQAHDRQRGDALATTGFADDGERLAAADMEGDIMDGLEQAGGREEHRFQVFHVEDDVVGFGSAHQPRCLGSRMSRKASPNRLAPNTARLMATPGKITSQGAVRTYSAADSDSMRPQDGCGSGTPRPRNDSDASVRIAAPSCAVAITISGATVFGSTCRSAMRGSLIPIALAAS